MSLMSAKNNDMIDTSNDSDAIELQEFRRREQSRFLWLNQDSKVFTMTTPQVSRMIESEASKAYYGDLLDYENINLSSMREHTRHSFPKSVRLSLEYAFKLDVIEEALDTDLKSLILKAIDYNYEKLKKSKK